MVNLPTADIADSTGAQAIIGAIRRRWPWLKHMIADGAYDRGKLMDKPPSEVVITQVILRTDKATYPDSLIDVVRRTDKDPGFKVLPRRWVVERTFGWMTRWRRLVRDFERKIDVSETMIYVAMASLLLARLSA